MSAIAKPAGPRGTGDSTNPARRPASQAWRRFASLLLGAALLNAWLEGGAFAQQICVRTPGYWQTHPQDWPADHLVLGRVDYPGHTYSQSELLVILALQARGDASVILATQLIAAKLNILQGASPLPVAEALARADILLGTFQTRLPYRTRTNSPIGADMVGVADILAAYNRGELPGACGTGNTPPAAHAGPSRRVRWSRSMEAHQPTPMATP